MDAQRGVRRPPNSQPERVLHASFAAIAPAFGARITRKQQFRCQAIAMVSLPLRGQPAPAPHSQARALWNPLLLLFSLLVSSLLVSSLLVSSLLASNI